MKIKTLIILISFWIFNVNANENSIFWQLKNTQGQELYIFGSIHVDDNRLVNFSDSVKEAMQKSDLLVTETNVVKDPEVLKALENEYANYLSDGDFEKINELSNFHSIEESFAIKLKPWLLGFIFSSPKPMNPFSQDNLLMVMGRDYGLSLKGLETIDEHYTVLDKLPVEEQFKILKNVLLLSEEKKEQNYELMIKTYLTFDLDKILSVDEKITKSTIPNKSWRYVKNELIHKRNKLFFERLMTLLKKNNLFVVVGASHLGGSDGVLDQFVHAGFKKKPLEAFKKSN